LKKKSIFFWCPFDDDIGTIKTVINSANGLNRYFNQNYNTTIIDSSGEWIRFSEVLRKNNTHLISLNKNINILKKSKKGFLLSKLSFIIVFFNSFFPLLRILKKEKPDILVAHLLTILPIILFLLFKFDTKLILRICGFPNINLFRKFFWKLSSDKIDMVISPSKLTKEILIKNNIFKENKIFVLYDPVISIKDFIIKKKLPYNISREIIPNNYILSIGRFTKQKNYYFLIENFFKLLEIYPNLQLVIIGEGEEKKILLEIIANKQLKKKIFLVDYTENTYHFYKNSKCFILTSLWEDPGFVLVEAAFHNKSIISSNCLSGPREFVGNEGGFLFETNQSLDFLNKFNEFNKTSDYNKNQKKLILKKRAKKFSFFYHAQELHDILENKF
jgi:glycosyltransferase involved in cell wall biosynthesis